MRVTCIMLRLLVHTTFLSLCSCACVNLEKAAEKEKERLLSENKAIEEQKQRLEEDVQAQTQEFKRKKQVSSFENSLSIS